MKNDPFVCLITGPAGAGKSSVSKLLATKFSRSAVVDVDHLRDMVFGGYVNPWPYTEETAIQTTLGVKNACDIANNFLAQGFTVFIDGVFGRKDFELYTKFLAEKDIKVFLLLPSLDALLARFDNRGPNEELRERTKELHEKFSTRKNESFWHVINSSNQTLEETAEQIFKELVK